MISYSTSLVYNTFPWPDLTDKQKDSISALGSSSTCRLPRPQLYDPDKMPESLHKAHKKLDVAVEQLYRTKAFEDASERVAFLFKRYEQLINTTEGAVNA